MNPNSFVRPKVKRNETIPNMIMNLIISPLLSSQDEVVINGCYFDFDTRPNRGKYVTDDDFVLSQYSAPKEGGPRLVRVKDIPVKL